jgi:hypothetical protein
MGFPAHRFAYRVPLVWQICMSKLEVCILARRLFQSLENHEISGDQKNRNDDKQSLVGIALLSKDMPQAQDGC